MGKILGALLPAAAAVAGSVISSAGAYGQNKAQLKAVQRQQRFEERMSNTAYQRKAEDIRKAGGNPMFAFEGAGASTPSTSAPSFENELAGFGAGVSSAGAYAMNKLQLEKLRAEILTQQAQAVKTGAEAKIAQNQASPDALQVWLDMQRGKQSLLGNQILMSPHQLAILQMRERFLQDTYGTDVMQKFADLRQTGASIDQLEVLSKLGKLGLNEAYNKSVAAKNFEWWQQNVAPLFNSATQVGNMVGSFMPSSIVRKTYNFNRR